ncbi:signal peptidase I [Anaerosolibacter carboniphilus]|uniref:Signal peptidase I n=1 Tax=Anaerosolibacter carboniphilus TaxID=1417629 RepID=A0A841L818_9FIRM|nr:signal peptidase I [Anaerosolibacter carboniphilus]MBB6218415.1 signal peptidase I [Anaerosolibacter carboniphilus]
MVKKEVWEWIKSIVLAVVISLVITSFITPLEVYSISMNPTLVEHDYLILQNTHKIEKGDIVSFETDIPMEPDELGQLNWIQRLKDVKTKNLIKRVIAVEGDELLIENGRVYVNGVEQQEEYINEDYTPGDIHIDNVPAGKIFVMGDNRSHSLDSRNLGLVDVEKVQGKVLVRVLPVSKIGKVE